MQKTPIAIFVSGRGSNAKAIIEQQNNLGFQVDLLVVSSAKAKAIDIAIENHIDYIVLDKEQFLNTNAIVNTLTQYNIELIILAGFLWKIPSYLINAFPEKILNIHPSLLPKYGGKGMYGMHIHKAVYQNKEKETGITIHLVNEHYDDGKILFQKAVEINKEDTPETIAEKVLKLEHKSFAPTIEKYLKTKMRIVAQNL
ncbi:MAG: phosphoribosylglycinamide formyltransferase [Chitinophagales bacterium]|nr:phosphoribosylglycinamide formyltransferase [Chitinophagales bacterium]